MSEERIREKQRLADLSQYIVQEQINILRQVQMQHYQATAQQRERLNDLLSEYDANLSAFRVLDADPSLPPVFVKPLMRS